ncbi:hypothetical protein CDAR_270791 [Caerostris darwini]|uniref:Uncharacterized protein n=1 Tax=Caerostris darwini TaxID=1538125 RepID=A0AAV4TED8_9ARAC|nr:hypothetical protein CDAR_270791 [Caerostris darwini]
MKLCSNKYCDFEKEVKDLEDSQRPVSCTRAQESSAVVVDECREDPRLWELAPPQTLTAASPFIGIGEPRESIQDP